VVAAWLSTGIMLPIGVYLTYRATTDQGLFDLDGILIPIKRFFAKKNAKEALEEIDYSYSITAEEEKMLSDRSANQLKDIVKNYRQYEYSEDMRNAAIDRLSKLGISVENLKVQGYYENRTYSKSEVYYKDFKVQVKWTLISYLTLISLGILFALFSRYDFDKFGLITYWASQITNVIFYILSGLSLYSLAKFYKTINKEQSIGLLLIFWLIGPLAFIFMYFYYNKRIKEEMEMIR
jgi:lipopolysaccharide export system permease protein